MIKWLIAGSNSDGDGNGEGGVDAGGGFDNCDDIENCRFVVGANSASSVNSILLLLIVATFLAFLQ